MLSDANFDKQSLFNIQCGQDGAGSLNFSIVVNQLRVLEHK